MTQRRWTPADLALAEQAIASGKPANVLANGSNYTTKKDEQQEQIWFVEWCRSQKIVCTDPGGDRFELRLDVPLVAYPGGASLSGNEKRRAMQWGILEKMGCKAGVADLVLYVPANGYHGMHIEMKKRRDQFRSNSAAANAVSISQTAFLNLMRRLGYFTCVAFGWVDAAKKICTYLGWDPVERGL